MGKKVANAVAELAGLGVFLAFSLGAWALGSWMDAKGLFSLSGWSRLISGG